MTEQRCLRRHYTRWTYCTCEACLIDRRRQQKRHRAGLLRPARVAQAWAAVDKLVDAGWTPTAIATAAGIPDRAVGAALSKRRRTGIASKWSHWHAERLIAIDATSMPTRGYIPVIGARRRLQALAAIGWSIAEITDRIRALPDSLDIPMSTLHAIRNGQTTGLVKPDIDRAIRAVYPVLEMTTAPVGKSAKLAIHNAIERGWIVPAWWDEATIDEPGEPAPLDGPVGVDEARVLQCADGRLHSADLTVAEREAVVRLLHRQGMNDQVMADRMQTTDRTTHRIRKRLGLAANTVESYGQVAG